MGKIRVKVSQGGGTDDDPAILGSGPVTVTLTAEDESTGGKVPGSMSVSLSVNGSVVGTPQSTPSGNASDALSYPFSGSAWSLPYTVTVTNAPSGTTFDGLTGSVGQPAFMGADMSSRAAEVPAPEPARRAMSFFQKIILFLRRLFGQQLQ